MQIDRACFVTVFNIGPTGNLHVLYPSPRSEPGPVEPGRPLRIGETVLTPPAGSERLVAVWSRLPLTVPLEQVLDRPGPAGAPRAPD